MLDTIMEICRRAGDEILAVYGDADFDVQQKSDDSPLTRADLASHRVIVDGLTRAFPDIPVLSEESEEISFEERGQWTRYFLVDPLDGTKEFINRNGEFTVNVALIESGVPTLGVVYVPVKATTYAGDSTGLQNEAFVEQDGTRRSIETRALLPRLEGGEPLIVVASRRHGGEALEACLETLNQHFDAIDTTNMGSSLKLCLIAAGEADLYPRLAPTSEWDTAAAQAVVEAAGGQVVDTDLNPLRYNNRESILNPHFYVIADKTFGWNEILK